jgi:ADP-heptose:LPS heptosyltransferase
MTPVVRLLAEEGHEVHVCTRGQTDKVFANNPYVKGVEVSPDDFEDQASCDAWTEECYSRYDKIIPLAWTVEKAYLHRTDALFGKIPTLKQRRKIALGKNYYDRNLSASGFKPRPVLPEIYASEVEQESLHRLVREKHDIGFKIVLWNLMGSTQNKVLSPGGHWINEVSELYPNARHFIIGNIKIAIPCINPKNKMIFDQSGAWDLRTVMLMTSIADLVVGPESMLVNAAACFETPKIIIYSHSSPDNLGRYYSNHYPVLPKCDCHPCYLIPINFRRQWEVKTRELCRKQEAECASFSPIYPGRMLGYKCVMSIDRDELIGKAVAILSKRNSLQTDFSLLSN